MSVIADKERQCRFQRGRKKYGREGKSTVEKAKVRKRRQKYGREGESTEEKAKVRKRREKAINCKKRLESTR